MTATMTAEPDNNLLDAPLCKECVMQSVEDFFFGDGHKLCEREVLVAYDPDLADMDFGWGDAVGEIRHVREWLTCYEAYDFRVYADRREIGGGYDVCVLRLEAM